MELVSNGAWLGHGLNKRLPECGAMNVCEATALQHPEETKLGLGVTQCSFVTQSFLLPSVI